MSQIPSGEDDSYYLKVCISKIKKDYIGAGKKLIE